MDLENAKQQMRKGVLELCILAIVSEREVYTGDILDRLKENNLLVVEGTLYPIMARLNKDGLVDYTWRENAGGHPRKYFTLTDKGSMVVGVLSHAWLELVQSVGKTLESGQGPAV
jgi:PadR family transcriptional regulator PadR